MHFFSEITSEGLYIHNISASTTMFYNSSITQLLLETPVVSASLKYLPSSWSEIGNNVTCSYTNAVDLYNSVSWTVPNNACIQLDVPGVYMYDAAFAVNVTRQCLVHSQHLRFHQVLHITTTRQTVHSYQYRRTSIRTRH